MRVKDLVDELSFYDEDAEIFVITNYDHVVPLNDISADSQGVYFDNDPDEEERSMR